MIQTLKLKTMKTYILGLSDIKIENKLDNEEILEDEIMGLT